VYVDHREVRRLLDPLETRAGSANELDDDQLTASIDRATQEIDARLSSRYSTPFADPVPPLVAAICLDLAAYDATLTYYGSVDLTDRDPVVLRYQRSIRMLTDLAKGGANLELAPDAGTSAQFDPLVINHWAGPMFTPCDVQARDTGLVSDRYYYG
jgi:phage gp36-like protein